MEKIARYNTICRRENIVQCIILLCNIENNNTQASYYIIIIIIINTKRDDASRNEK